ncbi:MAG: hypothetical protein Q9187_001538 [Circinaria calcarea]
MAAQFASLGLNAAVPLIQNYDVILEKSREKIQKVPFPGRKDRRKSQGQYDMDDYDSPRRSNTERQPHRRDYRDDYGQNSSYDRRDSYAQPRDSYAQPRDSGERISRDYHPPSRAATLPNGRARSAERDGYYTENERGGRQMYRPRGGGRDYDSSDSESSIPLRPRNLRRASSLDGGSRTSRNQVATRNREKDKDSDSSSSSDDISSSEDERQQRKIKHKAMLTAGLAAVATIHAASGVYSSMEAREKRLEAVLKGNLSPEEAKRERNKARLQDAAAIGIAALGIKGAYGKWQGVQASHKGYKEYIRTRKERHLKRLEKVRSRHSSPQGRPQITRGYSSDVSSNRRIRDSGPARYEDDDRDRSLTRYQDGNPYGGYRGR